MTEKNAQFFFRWFRAKRGLSQKDLGEALSKTKPYISQIENGVMSLPLEMYRHIYKICDFEEKKFLMDCLQAEVEHFLNSPIDNKYSERPRDKASKLKIKVKSKKS
jgi:transcriptional regulator with XRE-family HTH domain